MDLTPSAKSQELRAALDAFMTSHVLPAEPVYAAQRARLTDEGRPHDLPPVVEDLKHVARSRGLWNLFLPDESGLSVLDYAPLAEVTGWSPELAPEALNCAAPDTGNMEVLHIFGTDEQKRRWLEPLLAGEIRSGFAMTEPDVASSDATNISTSIRRDGDDYVINGRKGWTTGALDPRCQVFVVMGQTDAEADPYRRQSMILVPRDTPGLTVERDLTVFGYHDQHGHGELLLDGVRVPASHLLATEGDGFLIAQVRLGPGRVHHCMRAIGMAERGLDAICRRAGERTAFGKPVAAQGVWQERIAESRMAIDQARLLVLQAAWLIDNKGIADAETRRQVAAIKVVAPRVACDVLDLAIQVHGGAGVSSDTPLAQMYAGARTLRIADGPDEVHVRTVARSVLKPYRHHP
ncbi:MAG TPA: acyl-CoA dehydrogenase family protein [Candidatus Nanopelagicales bacterium]|nr:acyl-CoA dehydrogenase family protein [Candidatus Nanopelagicales bacterium]